MNTFFKFYLINLLTPTGALIPEHYTEYTCARHCDMLIVSVVLQFSSELLIPKHPKTWCQGLVWTRNEHLRETDPRVI